jgi:polar amino acid transport system substrate-binding protein
MKTTKSPVKIEIILMTVYTSHNISGPTNAENESSQIHLTKEEQAWIKAHSDIALGTDKRWAPFVIVKDDGTISGIEAGLIKRINEIAGTNIRIVVGKWQNIVEEAENREIDGLLISTAQEERAPLFLFSNSV